MAETTPLRAGGLAMLVAVASAALAWGCQSILGIKDQVRIADAGSTEASGPSFCMRAENTPSIANPVAFCEDFEILLPNFDNFENAGSAGTFTITAGKEGRGLSIASSNDTALSAFYKQRLAVDVAGAVVEAEFDVLLERLGEEKEITFLALVGSRSAGGATVTQRISIQQLDTAGTALSVQLATRADERVPIRAQAGAPASLLRLNQWARVRLVIEFRQQETKTAVLFNEALVLPRLADPSEAQLRNPTKDPNANIAFSQASDAGTAEVDAGPTVKYDNVFALIGAQTPAGAGATVRLDNIVLRVR